MPQVCAASTTVWVRADRQGTGLHLAVEDAGPGVPSELRAVVFERLHHGETAPSYAPGLGSGLSLIHLLAELHGGTAWIMADILTPAMRSSHRSHHS